MKEHNANPRRSRSRLAVLSALVLAAAGLAHGQVAGSTELAVLHVREAAPGWSVARYFFGHAVVNEHGEPIGRVQDVIVAPDGSVSHIIVGAGGFLGTRRHEVAVPAEVLLRADDKFVLVGATPELFEALPAFEYAR